MSTQTDLALVTVVDAENPTLGDLAVSGVHFLFVAGFDAVLQEVAVRLKWLRGEWFRDTLQGVPYISKVFRKGATAATIRSVIRRELRRVPGVKRVARIDLTVDRVTRYATIDVEIVGTDGSIGTVGVS